MPKGPHGVSDFSISAWPRNRDGTFRASLSGPRKARKIRYHDDEWERLVAQARACGMPAQPRSFDESRLAPRPECGGTKPRTI